MDSVRFSAEAGRILSSLADILAKTQIVLPSGNSVSIGGIEGNVIKLIAVKSGSLGGISVSLKDFSSIISCLENGARVLLANNQYYFHDGFHIIKGTGLSVIVNEVQLNNMISLHGTLGSVNFEKVIIYFYSQDWASPLLQTSVVPDFNMDLDSSLSVRFSTVNGVEY